MTFSYSILKNQYGQDNYGLHPHLRSSQRGDTSLNRARRAALGSFAGAVVDWYDFLLYGITAALVFNREFFPQVSPAMGTLAAFATFGVGFLFRPLGGVISATSATAWAASAC